MTTQQIQTTGQILEYYRRATRMTDPGKYATRFDNVPNDLAGLVAVVQGVTCAFQRKYSTPFSIVSRPYDAC